MNNSYKVEITNICFLTYTKVLQNKAKFRLPWQPIPQTVSDFINNSILKIKLSSLSKGVNELFLQGLNN